VAIDPVCSMQVDEKSAAGSLDHWGRRYHFCSDGCLEEFRADVALTDVLVLWGFTWLTAPIVALHRVRGRGIEPSPAHYGRDPLQEEMGRSSRRGALTAVTLGLCIAASLPMQHSLGRRWGEVPVSAGLGPQWPGGFYCPCHGSKFDFAGRVFRNVPAPLNLEIPQHKYLSDTRLLIGEDDRSA
jgi:YHS domain-containing protein